MIAESKPANNMPLPFSADSRLTMGWKTRLEHLPYLGPRLDARGCFDSIVVGGAESACWKQFGSAAPRKICDVVQLPESNQLSKADSRVEVQSMAFGENS